MVSPSGYNSGTKTWTRRIGRLFTNNTGSNVTVNEIGLIHYYTLGTWESYLFERSVLDGASGRPSPITMANGQTILAQYIFTRNYSTVD